MTDPRNLEELQARVAGAWRALVAAAFGLANAVNAQAADGIKTAERTLGDAARQYAAASVVLIDAMRPPAPKRPRRR